jgi:hypothetical protein
MAISADAYYEIIGANIPRFIELALQAAGDTLTTNIKARTFPTAPGEGKDANGVAIKNGRGYSKAYAKVRQEAELQTAYIDLSFTGNLQRNGIVENQTINKYVIDWSNNKYSQLGGWIEDRYDQTIFAASSIEAEKALDTFELLFFKQLDQLKAQLV